LFAGKAPLRWKAGVFQAVATRPADKRPLLGVAMAECLNQLSGGLQRQVA